MSAPADSDNTDHEQVEFDPRHAALPAAAIAKKLAAGRKQRVIRPKRPKKGKKWATGDQMAALIDSINTGLEAKVAEKKAAETTYLKLLAQRAESALRKKDEKKGRLEQIKAGMKSTKKGAIKRSKGDHRRDSAEEKPQDSGKKAKKRVAFASK